MTQHSHNKARAKAAAIVFAALLMAFALNGGPARAQQGQPAEEAEAGQHQPEAAPPPPVPPAMMQKEVPFQPAPAQQASPPAQLDRPRAGQPAQPSAPASKVDTSASRSEPLRAGEKINIDFNDVDVRLVVKFISEITGKNFVMDEKVKGKVTIVSPQAVTAQEALRVLESTLEVYGFSLVEAGRVTKVVPAMEARQRGAFKAGGAGDRMITKLFPMRFVKAEDMVNVLRPLVPAYSFITAFQATNTIIVVDYASNIEKLAAILGQLDSQMHEEQINVIQLKYAGAKEMAEKIEKIYKGRQGKGGTSFAPGAPPPGGVPSPQTGGGQSDVMVTPDERINAIIVIASKPMVEQIKSLVERLDVKPEAGRGGVNVRYLKNADAENMAKVLNNMTLAQPGQPQRPGGAPTQALKLQDKVTITPDKTTNALVITASVDDYETLDQVIDQLDVRRRQVFVETLIMEVSTDKTRQFGIEWRTTSNFTNNGVQGIGGTNMGNINAVAQNPLNAPQGLSVGVVDGIISYGGAQFLNIGALLHAMQSESGVNVLSTPNIMTTDNEEAEIIVAKNVPFQTSQSQTTGGNVISTFERKNIGLTLRIKPQISDSGEVRMNVYQEISSVLPTQDQVAKDIMTFTRSVKTTVVVHDSQNIVIGGLMSDNFTDQEVKVPFFGDIPLLGWMFKSMTKQKTKTNLLVFLTPHIINKAEDADALTNKKSGRLSESTTKDEDFGAILEERKESHIQSPAAPEKKPEAVKAPEPSTQKAVDVKPAEAKKPEPAGNQAPEAKPEAVKAPEAVNGKAPEPASSKAPEAKPEEVKKPEPSVNTAPEAKPEAVKAPEAPSDKAPDAKPVEVKEPEPAESTTPEEKPEATQAPAPSVNKAPAAKPNAAKAKDTSPRRSRRR